MQETARYLPDLPDSLTCVLCSDTHPPLFPCQVAIITIITIITIIPLSGCSNGTCELSPITQTHPHCSHTLEEALTYSAVYDTKMSTENHLPPKSTPHCKKKKKSMNKLYCFYRCKTPMCVRFK